MSTLPELHIPVSSSIVDVSIINSSGYMLGLPFNFFYEPSIVGHDYLAVPALSFLIEHEDTALIFDLGFRKDIDNIPPPLQEMASLVTVEVPTDVHEILTESGFNMSSIEGIIWSHAHFDHVGNPATFDLDIPLIVGPGFKEHKYPGYPTVETAHFFESDIAGREIIEISFPGCAPGLKIGHFDAFDYFGDGSFYILNSPGHEIGHISALARVTSNPDSFILMGGDAVHHAAVLRPHEWQPIPESISPNPFTAKQAPPCPGDIFDSILREGNDHQPFYVPSTTAGQNYDVEEMARSIHKLQETDAHDNILIIPAHDEYALNVVDLYPAKANDFMAKGWVEKTRWAFLYDFAKAVNYTGELYDKMSWAPPQSNQTSR
jgi:glyoxylase-like metal-dependent hydrolase (beta-lactamase superfamily II)